jgi:hypothetical protein
MHPFKEYGYYHLYQISKKLPNFVVKMMQQKR